MRNATLSAVVLALTLALPAAAKEVAGVQFPETLSAEGKELKLNGAGVRTKFIFQVYAAGLYVESTSQESSALVQSDQVKRVRMKMLRDLDKKSVTDAITEGFKKNAGDRMAALQERLNAFNAVIPDLKKGDELVLTYVPGKGTSIEESRSGKSHSVEGKDFSEALFSVWLGREPVDGGLKNGLLGK